MTKGVDYYEYDREKPVHCQCGWSGAPGPHEDYFEALLDVRCPECNTMLLMVRYPTASETKAAAEAGNEEAIAELKRSRASD